MIPRPPIPSPPALWASVLAFALGLATLPAAAQMQFEPETVTGTATVEQGDVISVGGRMIRLYGIDAPELGQTCQDRRGRSYDCGEAARTVLTRFLTGRTLACQVYANTIDGLETARCFVGQTDIGGLMVLSGWAFSYRNFSDRYEAAEAHAQAEDRGFWEGRAVRPSIWRTQELSGEGDD